MYIYETFILYLRHLFSNILTHIKHKLELIHENMFVKKTCFHVKKQFKIWLFQINNVSLHKNE